MQNDFQLRMLAFLTATLASCSISLAFAECSSDSLTINAKVPQSCEIKVLSTESSKHIMDLAQGGSGVLVGYANERCSDANGYTVTMVGTNSGDFTGKFIDSVSKAEHPFAVTYNGELVKKNLVTDSNKPAYEFIEKPIHISYAENTELPSTEGFTYRETLKFTICGK